METAEHPPEPKDSSRIKGVELPHEVIRQIRAGGFNPHALSADQLQAALTSFLKDGVVFDDPKGLGFEDMLTLTSDEIEHEAHWETYVREREETSVLGAAS